jgi:hypothetical protein
VRPHCRRVPRRVPKAVRRPDQVSGRDTYDPTRGLRECLDGALKNVGRLHEMHADDEQQVSETYGVTFLSNPELDVIESAIENLLDAQFFADRLTHEDPVN